MLRSLKLKVLFRSQNMHANKSHDKHLSKHIHFLINLVSVFKPSVCVWTKTVVFCLKQLHVQYDKNLVKKNLGIVFNKKNYFHLNIMFSSFSLLEPCITSELGATVFHAQRFDNVRIRTPGAPTAGSYHRATPNPLKCMLCPSYGRC